ncbi:HpcH/HpaI aldolase [Naematelia encephala]|uniref:HpcH/HpaI aldolase n=1 Tax=Naematelia encephala TaxID=71784 RepID=A0A1Y2BDH7_9TREE|nr:HpcH/HpaI aldolase [Naematelia encephala]
MTIVKNSQPSFKDEADRRKYEEVLSIARPNAMLETMRAGGLALCHTMSIARGPEIIAMAKYAGYDALSINLEHERNSFGETVDACCTALMTGMTPVVIVPSLQNDWVSRMLDNGAQMIIVPRTNDAAMAKQLVKFGKHRPLGERPLAYNPAMQYRIPDFKWTQYVANETTMCVPMIETVEGLENCEEIAAVPGVDAIFVGAHDLSDDMGIAGEFFNPKVQEAIGRICKAAQKASTPEKEIYIGLGGLDPYPDLFRKLRAAYPNIRFTNAGRDVIMLSQGMELALSKFRDAK